jgi:hypothetical protein
MGNFVNRRGSVFTFYRGTLLQTIRILFTFSHRCDSCSNNSEFQPCCLSKLGDSDGVRKGLQGDACLGGHDWPFQFPNCC